jgi:hypothetical protein
MNYRIAYIFRADNPDIKLCDFILSWSLNEAIINCIPNCSILEGLIY